jgi:hypothetical protein
MTIATVYPMTQIQTVHRPSLRWERLARRIMSAARPVRVSWSIMDTPMVIAALVVRMNVRAMASARGFGVTTMLVLMDVKRATTAEAVTIV